MSGRTSADQHFGPETPRRGKEEWYTKHAQEKIGQGKTNLRKKFATVYKCKTSLHEYKEELFLELYKLGRRKLPNLMSRQQP